MIEISINNKKYKLPTSFDDITLKDYCNIFKGLVDVDELKDDKDKFIAIRKNEAKILARLLKEDDDFVLDLPLSVYDRLSRMVSFIYDISKLGKKNEIEMDGKKYKIGNVSEFSTRKYIDIDVTMKDESDEQFLELLAILLDEKKDDGTLKVYDGNYQSMKRRLEKIKASQALPLLYFFLRKRNRLKNLTQVSSMVSVMLEDLSHQHTRNS